MNEEIKCLLQPEGEEPFWIEMAGISYCDGSYLVRRERSPVDVFEYVIQGTGIVEVDGVRHTASSGNVYVLPQGRNHRYYSDDKNPWVKVFFNSGGPLTRRLMETYGLENRVVFGPCDLEPVFLDIYHTVRSNLPLEVINRQCALRLHEIVQGLDANSRDKPEISKEALMLKQILDSSVERKLSIEELAASIYRSKDYAIKLFKREFGQTPYTYLLRKKMDMARNLLTRTKLPVGQIAFHLGYEDQHYFSNIFKKETGMSPRKYREQH